MCDSDKTAATWQAAGSGNIPGVWPGTNSGTIPGNFLSCEQYHLHF